MNTRRITAALALAMAAGTLALAGCGSSDTASTAATATEGTSTTGTSTAASASIPCVGAEEACAATIPLGGGASNRTVQVELTGTDMGEPKITIDPEYAESYDISDATFTTGGSIYRFTLNAVESIPEGVNLEMAFAQRK